MEQLERGRSIVGFDLHHVLARPIIFSMLLNVFSFTTISEKFWLSLYAINPFFWYDVWLFYKERAIPERITKKLVQKYPGLSHLRLCELIQELSNCQEPHLETWDLVFRLKQEEHILCLTSNITTNYLLDLKEKWRKMSPTWKNSSQFSHLPEDLFSLFDFCFTTDEIDDYQRKPSVKYFERWLEIIKLSYGSSISLFFIDDSRRNLESASTLDKLDCIHYTSPQKLYWKLQNFDLIP